MLTAEQRYWQAMRKARLQWQRNLRLFLSGEEPIAYSLFEYEQKALIAALARGAAE